jgi:hypothetical protein
LHISLGQVTVLAADLLKLAETMVKAKERFGTPNSARVVSCYELSSIVTYELRVDNFGEEFAGA